MNKLTLEQVANVVTKAESWKLFEQIRNGYPVPTRIALGERPGDFITPHMRTPSHDLADLCLILSHPELFVNKKKPVFLDLGSGAGQVVIYAAHLGWQAYGIDFDKKCYEVAMSDIEDTEKAGFIPKGSAVVALGDFLPGNMKVWRFEKHDPFSSFIHDKLADLPAADNNPLAVYDKLGIKTYDVDFFYHFQVELQDNLLRLMKLYAKSGSVLLVHQTIISEVYDVPSNLDCVGRFGIPLCPAFGLSESPTVLYQKCF